VAAEVLELAGTVAHTSERKFAPLASFVAQLRRELKVVIIRQPSDDA
jgi:hypothetical protein